MIRFMASMRYSSQMAFNTHMAQHSSKNLIGIALYGLTVLALGAYFALAAVQGNNGIFHRAEVEADLHKLQAQYEKLDDERQNMRNLTLRLSDDYLDLDLLDQQARDILGLMRADEVLVN